jgi:hypothetical protein
MKTTYTQSRIQAENLDGPYFQIIPARTDRAILFNWYWNTNLGNVTYMKLLIFYWRRPFVRYIECFLVRD